MDRRDGYFRKFQIVMMVVFVAIALVIITDFVLPGEKKLGVVDSTSRMLENKYSVARNYYYAYYIFTQDINFPVSEDMYHQAEKGDAIEIRLSPIFRKVSSVLLVKNNLKETHTFRLATGFVFPILVLGVIALGYKFRERLHILVFVSEVVLLVDFIYLNI